MWNIRFNLFAIVDGQFCKISDKLELLKRAKHAQEEGRWHLPGGWDDKVGSFTIVPTEEQFGAPCYILTRPCIDIFE